jgi:hypothetical protein
MQKTPELRERFLRFREAYAALRLELVEGQASGRLVATEPCTKPPNKPSRSPSTSSTYTKN